MAKQDFTIEYEFSSTQAYGASYTARRVVNAEDVQSALTIARLIGFSEFGPRFTENCFDWRVVHPG